MKRGRIRFTNFSFSWLFLTLCPELGKASNGKERKAPLNPKNRKIALIMVKLDEIPMEKEFLGFLTSRISNF